jgi:subtilisin family serine protease
MEYIRYVVLRRPANRVSDGYGTSISLIGPEAAEQATLSGETLPVSVIGDLHRDPQTIAAAPEMPTALIEPFTSSSGARFEAWGLAAVGADASQFDGSGVSVAILDTGIDRSHPAFAGNAIVERDFTGTGDGDLNGHGTHCAGTVFGKDLNGRIGVARGVHQAFIGKVLDKDGRGTAEMAYNGMRWAAEQGANIISMSLGFNEPALAARLINEGWPPELAASVALDTFCKNLRLFDAVMGLLNVLGAPKGQPLVVAASGNASRRQQDARFRISASLPASARGIVSVGALGRTGLGLKIADFSNSLPTLCGPGVGIRSAWPGGTAKVLDGTSMACPHVAGVAALWWQALGAGASAEAVQAHLISRSDVIALAPGYDHTDVGYGLVKAP